MITVEILEILSCDVCADELQGIASWMSPGFPFPAMYSVPSARAVIGSSGMVAIGQIDLIHCG